MKKLALILALCICVLLVVSCKKNSSDTPEKGTNENNITSNEGDLVVDYKKPDFTKNAGFEVVKDETLNITYDGVHLIDEEKAQLDLEFSDGRKAILTVTGSQYFVDEELATHFSALDGNVEVSMVEGLDGIDHYYWTKDDTYYCFSTEKLSNFSNEEIDKVIRGFSIKAGENY